jgi:hypothetical protein
MRFESPQSSLPCGPASDRPRTLLSQSATGRPNRRSLTILDTSPIKSSADRFRPSDALGGGTEHSALAAKTSHSIMRPDPQQNDQTAWQRARAAQPSHCIASRFFPSHKAPPYMSRQHRPPPRRDCRNVHMRRFTAAAAAVPPIVRQESFPFEPLTKEKKDFSSLLVSMRNSPG